MRFGGDRVGTLAFVDLKLVRDEFPRRGLPEVGDEIFRRVVSIRKTGRHVLILTEGAMDYGVRQLGRTVKKNRPCETRAASAVGQAYIARFLEKGLSEIGLVSAQILVERENLTLKQGRNNLLKTLEILLEREVIPVVSENSAIHDIAETGGFFPKIFNLMSHSSAYSPENSIEILSH